MAARKQQHSKIKGISIRSNPDTSRPKNHKKDSERVTLDLTILLAETPEQCTNMDWENLPPVGRVLALIEN